MRAVLSIAALAALNTYSSAVALPKRDEDCYPAITCSGEYIVGALKVRNPDNSLHSAYFSPEGKKLATKYNGTPAPSDIQFAIKVCNDVNYDKRAYEGDDIFGGFIVPNDKRTEALTVARAAYKSGLESPLYAAEFNISCNTGLNSEQYFTIYTNHTSDGSDAFYSLAYSPVPTGATAGYGYSPMHSNTSDAENIFISETEGANVGNNLDGYVNAYGYSLEIHP